MSPISGAGGTGAARMAGAVYDVKVAKKVLDSVDEQGQQAVRLIQAAAAAPAQAGAVGQLVNLMA